MNWVTIGQAHFATVYYFSNGYISSGFPEVAGNRRQMIPPIVEDGVFLPRLMLNKSAKPRMTRKLAEARAAGRSTTPRFDGTAFLASLKK
ncbi:MAG TPA: hypothetical protein VGO59_10765 [Verrucomicrobiae bacterium]